MKGFLIISNPGSGNKRKYRSVLKRVITKIKAHKSCYKHIQTVKKADGKWLIPFLTSEITDIVVLGGDGTLNEVINGTRDLSIPLGIIPLGSGNDFVKNIEIGRTPQEQIDSAVEGIPRSVDIGICNGRRFHNGIGVGFDGRIVHDRSHHPTWLKGHAGYYYHVIKVLGTYNDQKFIIETDGQKQKTRLIGLTIGNGTTFGGGFKLTSRAKIDDGKLDICLIGSMPPLKRFLNIYRLSLGTHWTMKEISYQRVSNLRIHHNNFLQAHIDGEYLGNPPFDIQVIPKGMKIKSRNLKETSKN